MKRKTLRLLKVLMAVLTVMSMILYHYSMEEQFKKARTETISEQFDTNADTIYESFNNFYNSMTKSNLSYTYSLAFHNIISRSHLDMTLETSCELFINNSKTPIQSRNIDKNLSDAIEDAIINNTENKTSTIDLYNRYFKYYTLTDNANTYFLAIVTNYDVNQRIDEKKFNPLEPTYVLGNTVILFIFVLVLILIKLVQQKQSLLDEKNILVQQKQFLLDEKDKLIQQQQFFLEALAHDMGTPLTSIVGGAQLITQIPDKMEMLIDMIVREAMRLAGMGKDLMRLTCLNNEPPHFTWFSSKSMAEEALSVYEHVELSGEDTEMTGDIALLIQLLRNLVNNALHSDTKQLVRVTLLPDGFSVRDEGRGMTQEQIQHAFEPFWKADKARTHRHGGSGLGLTICKKIADMHRADLTIDSEPDHGTTVTFRYTTPLSPDNDIDYDT